MAYQANAGCPADMDSPDKDWHAVAGAAHSMNSPSDQDWSRMKPRIIQLYVEQGHTCLEVRHILQREGFYASERMYKGRFSSWGIDKKTIKDIEYEAMEIIHTIRRLQGEEIEFTVAHGQGRKTVTIAEINKHLARAKSAQNRKNHRAKLEEEGYPFNRTRARKEIEFHVVSLHTTSVSSSPEGSVSPSPGGNYHERLHGAGYEPHGFPVKGPSFHSQIAVATETWYPSIPTTTTPYRPRSLLSDFDLSSRFATTGLSSSSEGSDMIGCDPRTKTAMDWVEDVFNISMLTDRNLFERASEHRTRARRHFGEMLVEANPHILTSLFHISAVLSSLGRDGDYRTFLQDCCEVMRERNAQRKYMTPYRYALAYELRDQDDIEKYGRELEQCTKYCCELFGDGSPNVLVSMHFQAWHLLEQVRNVPEAVKTLETCLVQSDNVLDRTHLINVNCLTLLARAYKDQGDIKIASNLFADAVQRCEESPSIGPKHPYRLRYLRDLALLQSEVGLLADAERNLMEVLSGRRQTLGPGHGYTWGAIEDLKALLSSQNRDHEERCLRQELRDEHQKSGKFIFPTEAYIR